MKTIQELEKDLSEIREEKIKAVKAQNFEKACDWRDKEKDILEMIESIDHKNQKRNDLADFLDTLSFEMNNPETRNQVRNKISELWGYEFKDVTTPELVDNGFMSFEGYNSETKKTTNLTVSNK